MKEENKLNTPISNWDTVKGLLLSTRREGMESLVDWLEKSDFIVAPASTQYHGSYEGGLLEHSLNVYNELVKQTKLIKLFNIPADSLIITALLHDICKVNYYKVEMRNVKVNGAWVQEPFYKVDDFFPVGHAEKSIIILQQFIKMNEVEIAMIRGHMGGFVSDQYFSPSALYNKYPEAVLLQYADMIATYVLESPGMLEDFKDGLEEYLSSGDKK